MDELKITKRTEPVMFTIRVDKSIVDFYDDLAQKTNRSRNELIGLALEYAKDKIKIEVDPARVRPTELMTFIGNYSKFKSQTGWNIRYKIDETLETVLNYWRNEVAKKEMR